MYRPQICCIECQHMTAVQELPTEPVPSLAERLIRFETPEQIRTRELWRDDLDPQVHKPVRILGGYRLPATKWLACGMSTCRTMHGVGYVVATSTGLETHIGQDCGRRLFQEVFSELERSFQRAFDAQTRKDLLEDLLKRKEEVIATAILARQSVESSQRLVYEFLNEIYTEPSLSTAFDEAKRNGGNLWYSRQKTEREMEISGGRERFVRETAGHLDGLAALEYSKLGSTLQYQVIGPLQDLTREGLAALTDRRLEEKSKLVGELRSRLGEAGQFGPLVRRFTRPRNWEAFKALFATGRLKTNQRGERVLNRLIARAQELHRI